ncbi:hypothetical protein BH11ARM2_BH11ARM2_34400 [soil metagenome]
MIEMLELHAYVDGEMAKKDAERVRAAISSDPKLATEVRAIETLKAATLRHARPCECEDSWRVCVGRLNELDRTRRVEGFFARYAWALCGAAFVAIVTAGLLNRGPASATVGSTDLARVASALGSGASAPQPTPAERQWVRNLLGQAAASLDPNRLSAGPMALGEFDGHRVARIPVRDGKGDLALFVFENDVRFGGLVPLDDHAQYAAGKIAQLNCVAWATSRGSFVLVGDRSPQDLGAVASRIPIGR